MIEKDIVMIGCGPSSLAVAIAIEESSKNKSPAGSLILERKDCVCWHPGMLFREAQSQVSFLKDLVTQRNPRSRYSFLNFLHEKGRLEAFVNLQTFNPFRSEISDYLAWVAASLERTTVKYNSTVSRIEPLLESGDIYGWRVSTAEGKEYRANRLIFGAGRDLNIPDVFRELPRNRIIHSANFLTTLPDVMAQSPASIAVIGGAQSSAEMYQYCLTAFPEAKLTMIMRSIGLVNYESSLFTNTLFQNDYIDTYYSTADENRGRILAAMHTANYSGVAPSTLQSLYQFHYLQELAGSKRARMLTQCDIISADDQGDGVYLTWRDKNSGEEIAEKFDIILLGTGYLNSTPSIFDTLREKLDLTEIKVGRKYRVELPCKKGVSLHLQGVNENTHGIADSLLSVLAYRAQEIMDDIQNAE